MSDIKIALDSAIKEFEVMPVNKYYELITRKEKVIPFINAINILGIKIKGFDWWCFVDESHADAPHGGGGLKNRFGDGWFSEMYWWDNKEFAELEPVSLNNQQYVDFYLKEFPKEKCYLSCIVPGFNLKVPEVWRNEYDK